MVPSGSSRSDGGHGSNRSRSTGSGDTDATIGDARHSSSTTVHSNNSNWRHSTLSRKSSTNSVIRETLFRHRRDDPLVAPVQQEFQMAVIDERGGMDNNFTDIFTPTVQLRGCSPETYMVVAVGVVTVFLTFLLTMCTKSIFGYEIDPGLVFGSFQTLTLCTIVFITYHGVQAFQAHPNPLIYYRCVIDMVLALRFLLDPMLLQFGAYEKDDPTSCGYLSGVTQFLYFASDCWYFSLIIDLYISLKNPFTSVQGNRKLYKCVVYSVAVLSAVITVFTPGAHGFADGKYCWTNRGDTIVRNFWKLNVATWLLFYDFMIIFYVSGIAVLIFGFKRLRSGLADTLKTRQEMLRNGAISIMSYTVYWTLVFLWYAASYSARTHYEGSEMVPNPIFRTFTYTLTGRGAVTYFVWFMINKPSMISPNWLKYSTESADTKFSAHLNKALQGELIYFTIEGMTKSVELADAELQRRRESSPSAPSSPQPAANSPALSDSQSEVPVMGFNQTVLSSLEMDNFDTASQVSDSSRGTAISFVQAPGSSASTADVQSGAGNAPQDARITFTPYKTEAFAELREAFGIRAKDFVKSFETNTKPSISEGASGAFLFFSGDKKYIVKSMAESECRFLCENAEAYVDYLQRHPESLITKFFGCFKITLHDVKFYFVVMENLFDVTEQGVTIHHRYDIKGSWVSRSYKRPRRGAKVKCRHCSMQFRFGAQKSKIRCPNVVGVHEPNVVLKDNDLRTRMRIGAEAGRELFHTLREDSLFLCSLGIMDYSLLLGVVDVEFEVESALTDRGHSKGKLRQTEVHNSSFRTTQSSSSDALERTNSGHTVLSVRSLDNVEVTLAHRESHDSQDSRALMKERRTMRQSERIFGPAYYYVGIIDILQTWNWNKKLERFWKVYVNRADPDGLSAIEPRAYQERFERKLREIIAFPKDDDHVGGKSTRGVDRTRFNSTRGIRGSVPRRATDSPDQGPNQGGSADGTDRTDLLRLSDMSLSPDDDDSMLGLSGYNPQQILMQRMVPSGSGRLNISTQNGSDMA
ncbi:TPA: hypothetical protein N0F65_007625 [Lagenidium giganteum]|uniref:Uncharacterized protein n=1 Tax=Lagenidium giganteum TaxID=4803 RepID=A0AAV2Z8S6_9STRA|nr:TPA: hypothetical protein N0F65_007625 [Lagenidium giganteum]